MTNEATIEPQPGIKRETFTETGAATPPMVRAESEADVGTEEHLPQAPEPQPTPPATEGPDARGLAGKTPAENGTKGDKSERTAVLDSPKKHLTPEEQKELDTHIKAAVAAFTNPATPKVPDKPSRESHKRNPKTGSADGASIIDSQSDPPRGEQNNLHLSLERVLIEMERCCREVKTITGDRHGCLAVVDQIADRVQVLRKVITDGVAGTAAK